MTLEALCYQKAGRTLLSRALNLYELYKSPFLTSETEPLNFDFSFKNVTVVILYNAVVVSEQKCIILQCLPSFLVISGTIQKDIGVKYLSV